MREKRSGRNGSVIFEGGVGPGGAPLPGSWNGYVNILALSAFSVITVRMAILKFKKKVA